jgi:Ca2+-binding RTX toxin-like protein
MESSQNTKLLNLNLLSLLGGLDVGNILDDLLGGGVLDLFDLGDIFDSLLGGSDIFGSLDLGSIFDDLGVGSSFDSVDLSDIFDSLGELGKGSGVSLDGLIGDLEGLFGKLDLGDIFEGLDDDYYYLFDKLSADDFLGGLGQISGLTGSNKKLNIKDVDLLDGFGSVLNVLGETDLLKDLSIQDILTGDLKGNLLKGNSKDDLLLGRKGNDRLLALKGDDLVNGGDGNDFVDGGTGNDLLVGKFGNDDLNGGNGDDILAGGEGNNKSTGGRGDDLFLLQRKGNTLIRDFDLRNDKLVVLGNVSFDDLQISQRGDNAIVSLGGKQLAMLQGVDAERITEKMFSALG